VTRDYGSERLLTATAEDPPESETVMRLLDREAEITTRYGGGFVQSIEGLAGGTEDGRRFDWFFYVNGIESPIGAAGFRVHGGDRVWWDHRDWTAAMRVPAVVGSWPEPFAHGFEGRRYPVEIVCLGEQKDCGSVAERLEDEGVDAAGETGATEEEALRILVGPWSEVRDDRAAAQIESGPATSGVFADLAPILAGGYDLVTLDARAQEQELIGAGDVPGRPSAGLVAAVRLGEEPPTWVVTGTDDAGVEEAVELLDEDVLRDHYAVAVEEGGEPLALPVRAGRGSR
jgi:hypothetical protein